MTVIELMAVVCIVGILSAAAMVSFKPMLEKHRLSLSTQNLEGILQSYRMKAILQNTTYEIRIGGEYLLSRRQQDEHWEEWRKHQFLTEASVDFSGSVYIDGKGFMTPKTIHLRYGKSDQYLVININGRMRRSELQ